MVEVRFRLLPAMFSPFVPGYVDTDFRQRGIRDYRLDAELDVGDLYRIIIPVLLYYNNHHVLKGYVRHSGLTEDGVPSIPVNLFEWGIANLSGRPRMPPMERFRLALMPTVEASVTPQGILFQGRLYSCRKALAERWFTRARDERFKTPISYDPRLTDHIFVHDSGAASGFDLASLTAASQNRAGISCAEAAATSEPPNGRSCLRMRLRVRIHALPPSGWARGPAALRRYGPLLEPALRRTVVPVASLRTIARMVALDPKTLLRVVASLGIPSPWGCRPSGASRHTRGAGAADQPTWLGPQTSRQAADREPRGGCAHRAGEQVSAPSGHVRDRAQACSGRTFGRVEGDAGGRPDGPPSGDDRRGRCGRDTQCR